MDMLRNIATYTRYHTLWSPAHTRFIRRYATDAKTPPTSRIGRVESRLPRFLQHIITPLRNAPVSHITAFIVLHEITAIVPLLGLAAAFHYGNYLPPFISEGKWVRDGMEKYGNYLRKKGWISEEKRSGRWFGRGQAGVSMLTALATAYAITKAMLPLRLVISVWATPWFARWTVLPITRRIGRFFPRKKATPATVAQPAAGTGAVAAGALSKEAKPR